MAAPLRPALCDLDGAYVELESLCDVRSKPVLGGADVVAYRALAWAPTAGAGRAPAVAGSARHNATVGGGFTYWFASEENRLAFLANGSPFAPAVGGFCAYGLTGHDPRNADMTRLTQLTSVPTDPDVWYVDSSGSLFLFRGDDAMALFLDDAKANALAAQSTWNEMLFEAHCQPVTLLNTQCFHKPTDELAPPSSSTSASLNPPAYAPTGATSARQRPPRHLRRRTRRTRR